MSFTELWFSDTDDENEREESRDLRIKRRNIRDSSNPLDVPDTIFLRYFRVSKEAFVFLLEIVKEKTKPAVRSFAVPPIIKLAAALRFLAEGSYQKGVGNDFNVGLEQPTFAKILNEILIILENEICNNAIKFPDEAERKNVKLGFFEKFGFPGVVGCLDGTHVKIISPSQNEQHLYYNRKGYHSLNVMLVCDHKMRITFVDANNPGSSHDSFIWNYSRLNDMLATEFDNGERNTWILGDAGYPLRPYLITPFRTPDRETNSREGRFNTLHSKSRCIIERAIGLLKNTFRCLLGARELHYKPEKAALIVNVCCALHNLRIKYNIRMEEVEIAPDETGENVLEINDNEENACGIRNNIMNSII